MIKQQYDWSWIQGIVLIIIGIGMMFLEHYKPFLDLGFIPYLLVVIGAFSLIF